jgi:ABC-type multidrug transport system ATPase subunit
VGGQQVKGISGGEKKRTSIAYELISDPQVLMLDEPTSGLDSLTSFVIVRYLSELARTRNKTIVMTIHQPNSEIFALFDKLILMVEGRLIYQGPAESATAYFSKEFGLTCPEFHNPADYFMSIMHQEVKENVERYPTYYTAYDNHFTKGIETGI